DILALVDNGQTIESIFKKSLDHQSITWLCLRHIQRTEIKETTNHVTHITRRIVIFGFLHLTGLVIEYLHLDLLIFVIEVRPLILLVPTFPDAADELMRNQSGRIDIGTPIVVHVCYPVHYPYSPPPYIDLVALAAIHLEVFRVNLG